MGKNREDKFRQEFWRSLSDLQDGADRQPASEFAENAAQPFDTDSLGQLSRRRFISLLGASAALAAASGCTAPEDRGNIIPYNKKPPELLPGIANHYASTFQEYGQVYPVLVKAREGRPIHIEGNDRNPDAAGKTSHRAIADILSLYDPERVAQPLENGEAKSWDKLLDKIAAAIKETATQGRKVLLFTPAILSPSRNKLLSDLKKALPNLEHCCYEPLALTSGKIKQLSLPESARIILNLGSDFLATEGNFIRSGHVFSAGRRINSGRAVTRLYTAEGRLSLTGMNSDYRFQLPPSLLSDLALCLAQELHKRHKIEFPAGVSFSKPLTLKDFADKHRIDSRALGQLAADLSANRENAAVITGAYLPAEVESAASLLQQMLNQTETAGPAGQYEITAACATASEIKAITKALSRKSYGVVIFWDVNPAYSLPSAAEFSKALEQAPLKVKMGLVQDETSRLCQLFLPVNHWLESWGDALISEKHAAFKQPLLQPLFDSRLAEDIFLQIIKNSGAKAPASYYDYLKDNWRGSYAAVTGAAADFETFWSAARHDGIVSIANPSQLFRLGLPASVRPDQSSAKAFELADKTTEGSSGGLFELVLHPDYKIFDGRYAGNGWLQELPDPISKVVWGNPLVLSPEDAAEFSLKDGDHVELTFNRASFETPVLIQPGQCPGVLSLALGYGRKAGPVAEGIGLNAFPLLKDQESFLLRNVELRKTGRSSEIVRTQGHYRIGDLRKVDQELIRVKNAGDAHHAANHEKGHSPDSLSIYPEREFKDYKWEMTIDLNSCIGCGNCTIACQSENNIPVVGPEQVSKGREMHWIRLDTYYQGEPTDPEFRWQPMLCQHCDNAPCENVCPVLATTQSPDGLNQMTYNRCVGTRYCANNCPYKVRRFNFFDFLHGIKEPQQMVFNPEVSLRPRGVMEKCTFCIQRIQDAKQIAKRENRKIADGEVVTACQAACPTKAITFGNILDSKSQVAGQKKDPRAYRALEDLGIRPALSYLSRYRNTAPNGGRHEA